jgi:hypothetical protein
MSTRIRDYMAHLAEDDQARERHRRDPQAAMADHGLDDEEREIVASGDHDRIRGAVRESDPGIADTMSIIL